MPCGVFTVEDVPAAKVDITVAMFEANVPPPLSVTKKKQANGLFVVVATFEPCPSGTVHSPGG
mgnify:CR=1 FL=1